MVSPPCSALKCDIVGRRMRDPAWGDKAWAEQGLGRQHRGAIAATAALSQRRAGAGGAGRCRPFVAAFPVLTGPRTGPWRIRAGHPAGKPRFNGATQAASLSASDRRAADGGAGVGAIRLDLTGRAAAPASRCAEPAAVAPAVR